MKARYFTFLVDKEKLVKFLNNRQEEIDKEMERKRFEAKQEQQREEERRLTELRLQQEEQVRRMWQKKIDAELQAMHKRLGLEKEARSTTAKLPELVITPFKGTPTDWVRSENMLSHKSTTNRSVQKRNSAIIWKWLIQTYEQR